MQTEVYRKKTCPSCHEKFECLAESGMDCQCTGVELTNENRNYLKERFKDCLCLECLKKIAVANIT